MSTQSFADLGVSKPVVDVLAQRGVTAPFAVQQLVMSDVLDGSDVLFRREAMPADETPDAERPAPERAAWKAFFDHYVFRADGHPLRHLPAECRRRCPRS